MNFKDFKKLQIQKKIVEEAKKKADEAQKELDLTYSLLRFKWFVENIEALINTETCIINPHYNEYKFYGDIDILRKGFEGPGRTWFNLSFSTFDKDVNNHRFSFTEYSEKGIPIFNLTLKSYKDLEFCIFECPEDIKSFEEYLIHLYYEQKNCLNFHRILCGFANE